MQAITPFLLFDGQADEAAHFYVSVFPDGEILDWLQSPDGALLTVTFRILAQTVTALNGPHVAYTPAVSLFVPCDTQAEIDHVWGKLVEGGAPLKCGWLTDRYGLSWQVVPTVLGSYLRDPDRAKAKRAFQAMLDMVKLDVCPLQRAFEGA